MGRIEYWLLGAVGALIAFITVEVLRPPGAGRATVDIAQQGHAREVVAAPLTVRPHADSALPPLRTVAAVPGAGDVNSSVRRSSAPVLKRNLPDIRRRLAAGAQGTYMLEMLALQDSVLYRWPDSRDHGVRVWIQADPHIRDWWIGYVGSAREVFAEWEAARLPIRFEYPTDSTGADIVIRWIDQFPPNELRIGKTRRLADHNAWVTHAEIVVALHDRDGDTFPPGEVHEILRHEIGHALGLGHSNDRGTIMYPENTQLDITPVDRETLRLLYTLPPGSIK